MTSPFRISTNTSFNRFLSGVQDARFRSAVAQEQLSSGRRILRPSDDPAGAGRALTISRRLSGVERYAESIASGSSLVDSGASHLEQAGTLVSEARALVLQAMNGTLSPNDRKSIATEFELLRGQLFDIGNQRLGDQFLFGGTRSDAEPWEEVTSGGRSRVIYRGDDASQRLRIGESIEIAINLPGSEIFAGGPRGGTELTGSTGLAGGVTANEGTGYEILQLRHDATDAGALGSVGVALANGGDDDTLLGDNALVIDTTAGTVQLGSGPARPIPQPGDPDLADFVLENEDGGTLHLDFTGFTNADYTGTVTGEGSISIDGSSFTPLDFTETDLELVNPATGSIVHVDTTGVTNAGEELVTFTGTLNVFDLMQGIEEDLKSADQLPPDELVDRLEARLAELDAAHERLISATSTLGARSQRLAVSGQRALDLEVQLQGLLSETQDADITEVALDLARADSSLQLAQTAGARLLQTTLLNFLG